MPAHRNESNRINDYAAVRISLANAHDIRDWSHGEVKSSDTLNFRTGAPVPSGLMCERIFGPLRDWRCRCGKYAGIKYRGMRCERCGVQLLHHDVRRHRFGHIELATPVVHSWFFRHRPNRLAMLLDMKPTEVEAVIYFQKWVVMDQGSGAYNHREVVSEEVCRRHQSDPGFRAESGAAAIAELLRAIDLAHETLTLRNRLAASATKSKADIARRDKLASRLQLIEGITASGNQLESMILSCLPVIPADMRPMVQLDSGSYATSDVNDLYRRVICRNNRLKRLKEVRAPEIIIRNEMRMLQQSVDALFDNSRAPVSVAGSANRPLLSLTDAITGKQGLFRQNLLGKRVDYSARSVIVAGPELELDQCGLPQSIALELFKPFLIRRLIDVGECWTIREARKLIDRGDRVVWELLDEVAHNHPILLNRAPTLHRMNVQAFRPVLVEDNAIRLHPLVCKGFNADFDGDTMSIHVPLSTEAQVEATTLLLPTQNIVSPADGKPMVTPTQDMVLGCYYLTVDSARCSSSESTAAPFVFASIDEARQAWEHNHVDTHTAITYRLPADRRIITEEREKGSSSEREAMSERGTRIETTVGRLFFDALLQDSLPFFNLPMTGTRLNRLVDESFETQGGKATAKLVQDIMHVGFRWATRSGLSLSVKDLCEPHDTAKLVQNSEKVAFQMRRQFNRGLITELERSQNIARIWSVAREKVTSRLMTTLANDTSDGTHNPVHLMVASGARGSREQVAQLAGIRGQMAKPNGDIIETPITSNFRKGMSILDYFRSTHGARKGLADGALRTASAGYLTRRLVDAAHHLIVTQHDCGTKMGIEKLAVDRDGSKHLAAVVRGRVSLQTIVSPEGETIVSFNQVITREQARELDAIGIGSLLVRSPTTCQAIDGVCASCYGTDLSQNRLPDLGTAVGIIAAQSIGEPGTQLTLRTFHHGGVAVTSPNANSRQRGSQANTQDITNGLQRLSELFESPRTTTHSRRYGLIAPIHGRIGISSSSSGLKKVTIQPHDERGQPCDHAVELRVSRGLSLLVKRGDWVNAGDLLTPGIRNAHDVLHIEGRSAAQRFLIEQIQAVYQSHDVWIDDRHVEVIVAAMSAYGRVESAGDTALVAGTLVSQRELATMFLEPDEGFLEPDEGNQAGPCTYAIIRPVLLGLTRTALASTSFISAASFQETAGVLADAALAGRIDPLRGLKENVILGRLIPAGTGFVQAV